MKKILFLALMLTVMVSCEVATLENSVENPSKFTTVEKQNQDRDTIIVSRDELKLFIWEDDLIVARYDLVNNDSSGHSIGNIIKMMILSLVLGFSIARTFK